jgi:hypothetical protein
MTSPTKSILHISAGIVLITCISCFGERNYLTSLLLFV